MAAKTDKSKPPLYINRELSWIDFNARVLSLAQNKKIPLFERLKFLSIVSSNFDEFFMVRVAGLKRQSRQELAWKDISGFSAKEQLAAISKRAHELFDIQHTLFGHEIINELKKEGIVYTHPSKFSSSEKQFTENLFREQVFPLLTPLRAESENELPPIANLKVHVAFLLNAIIDGEGLYSTEKTEEKTPLAFVQVPSMLDRIIWLPSQEGAHRFSLLDDIIVLYGTSLFPGYSVGQTLVFKAVCDAAFAVDEESDENFIKAMEDVLIARKKSVPIRLTCTSTGGEIAKILIEKTSLKPSDVYSTETPFIDLKSFIALESLEGFSHLRYPSWRSSYPASLEQKQPLWDVLKQKDILLHVPYESYEPVLQFVNDAAEDDDVLAIKMTLYRTSGNSPLIKSLIKAARNGKQVTVFVEVKARFDEERNMSWANILQQEGAIVIYGLAHLKVHAKMLLVVRRETAGFIRYVHMGTGNYNEKTSRLYVDMSLFTTNIEIANDVNLLFNMISGYSAVQSMNRLFMAPVHLKAQLLAMIEREIKNSTKENPGLIMAKMNSLAHPEIIRALYRASCNHVKILLNVRGICMLVPGVKGQSENIKVISIVDRYLEHTRIFYFQNGSSEEIYLSSADWMPRNLEKRVELMFPILQQDVSATIKDILHTYFLDNQNSYILNADSTWTKIPSNNEQPLRSQEHFYAIYKKKALKESNKTKKAFTVRRKSKNR